MVAEPEAAAEAMRDLLPAIEPERQVSDWGRSERVEGALDRTLYDFLYHYWFRCDVEGIENVPADGGALLVSNHSGALPPDASMIAKAIQEEHPRPRKLHLTVEHFFKGYPFFSMFVAKIGGVPAHPANVQRLLHDEQQLVLTVGGVVAHEGRAVAGSCLPVDVLDLVAGDVGAQVVEVHAAATAQRRVLAVEEPHHPPVGADEDLRLHAH